LPCDHSLFCRPVGKLGQRRVTRGGGKLPRLCIAEDSFCSSRRKHQWRKFVGLCRLRGRRCGHPPWHQRVDPVDGMSIGEPGQNILKVGLRIQTVEPCRGDKRIEGCRRSPRSDRATDSCACPVRSCASRSRRCCCRLRAVRNKAHQGFASLEDVAERLGERRLG
jgi:hypothetical protein